jgi:hypothetical protein
MVCCPVWDAEQIVEPVGARNPVTLCNLGVFVQQAAKPVSSDHRNIVVHRSIGKAPRWFGLAQATVRAVSVEVLFVLGRDHSSAPGVEDQDPVEQFPTDTCKELFGDRVCSRRPHRSLDHVYPRVGEHGVEADSNSGEPSPPATTNTPPPTRRGTPSSDPHPPPHPRIADTLSAPAPRGPRAREARGLPLLKGPRYRSGSEK